MTDRKPDAPSGPCATVARLASDAARIARLEDCVREQRAALESVRDDCKRCVGLYMQEVIKERLLRITRTASDTLAKYAQEVTK